jgi:Uma2 family endonuclease
VPMLVLDPAIQREFHDRYERFTETWDGVDVVPPLPNDEHQEVQFNFAFPLADAVVEPKLGVVRMGVNVTDRKTGWSKNFRGPDLVVYLVTNPAVNHGTHWEGGPDFLVEIISDGEDPHAKFDFYAKVNTREVLIVERDPWAVELFQLAGGKLVSAGRSDLANGLVLASGVLSLTFRLIAGTPRPQVEVTNTATGRQWPC